MVFDAIIKEFLRFIKDHEDDLENSEMRGRIELILKGELLTNSHLPLDEFVRNVANRIIIGIEELALEGEASGK